jgi:6-phosphogluconolactonase
MAGTLVTGERSLQVRHFGAMDALATALAELVRDTLGHAVAARGTASLVVSGGSTPAAYFPSLARQALAWERVTITLADERWVPPSDAASNEWLVRSHLLRDRAAAASLVGLKTCAAAPCDAVREVDAALARIAHPYDLVLLGMGHDGHIASLFPGAPELAQALDPDTRARCVAITPPAYASPAVARLSMTLAELLRARRIVLVLQGAGKRAALDHALAAAGNGRAGATPAAVPVAALLARASVEVLLAE